MTYLRHSSNGRVAPRILVGDAPGRYFEGHHYTIARSPTSIFCGNHTLQWITLLPFPPTMISSDFRYLFNVIRPITILSLIIILSVSGRTVMDATAISNPLERQ